MEAGVEEDGVVSVERAIMGLMAMGAVVGGLDRMLGNRLGLGKRFEDGFLLMGSTALSMVGILCLVPLLSGFLEQIAGPLCRRAGIDPAMLAGILAIDMGGYQMAVNLAESPLLGRYSGILVAATLGCTVTFTIPVGMGMLGDTDRPDFARGILFGLVAMPFGLLIGGRLCKIPVAEWLWQNLPVLALSALLLLGIWRWTDAMVRGFSWFARAIQWATTLGLVAGAVQSMTGLQLIPGLAPIEEGLAVVGSIGVVMLGSLPLAEVLQRVLKRPLTWAGEKTGTNPASVTGLLIGMVSVLPAIVLVHEMDRRGKIVNAAFMVCSASAFAAHLGFAAGVDEKMILPLLATKLLGGAIGIAIALAATRGLRGEGASERA